MGEVYVDAPMIGGRFFLKESLSLSREGLFIYVKKPKSIEEAPFGSTGLFTSAGKDIEKAMDGEMKRN